MRFYFFLSLLFYLVIIFLCSVNVGHALTGEGKILLSHCRPFESITMCFFGVGAEAEALFELKQELLPQANKTVHEFERIFGYKLPERILVYLLPRKEFLDRTGAPKWASALYKNGIVYISVSLQDFNNPKKLIRSIRHEFVHVFVYNLSKGRCPVWLDEGLAIYLSESQQITKSRNVAIKTSSTYRTNEGQNCEFLGLSPGQARQAYACSGVRVKSLVFSKGISSIKHFLSLLRKGTEADASFLLAFGQSFAAFAKICDLPRQ